MAVSVRPGSRVYWHGTFPDSYMQGIVVATGELNHEVRWDGRETTNLVSVEAVGKIVGGKFVCEYGKDCGRCPR